MGVLHTLWHRQIAPGREVGVVGFDDSQVAHVVPPGLSSVRQPLEQVAVELVAALKRLTGRTNDPEADSLDESASRAALESEGGGVLLTPTLVVRGSSQH
ncbi:MAG: substrate-binding domain-containing protein [Nocardioides sp.]